MPVGEIGFEEIDIRGIEEDFTRAVVRTVIDKGEAGDAELPIMSRKEWTFFAVFLVTHSSATSEGPSVLAGRRTAVKDTPVHFLARNAYRLLRKLSLSLSRTVSRPIALQSSGFLTG